MTAYEKTKKQLLAAPATWLVTGAAGFIGCNLVETLLGLDQRVVGLDNFATGHKRNIDQIRAAVSPGQWARFKFINGDIRDIETCRRACANAQYVLHQAALGSVPRSIEDPLNTHGANSTGFITMLHAAREAGVRRFVYASSSAIYGDHEALPKVEALTGNVLSPYAATKAMNEIYARVFARCYGIQTIGLRYFNVFGPHQDPDGAYAAVVPKWVAALIQGHPVRVNGDGETSRDFCYIKNVVQANILAATTEHAEAANQAYNIAFGGRTTLNQLFEMLRTRLLPHCPHLKVAKPEYGDFRAGDVRHSQADISKARRLLGYEPTHDIAQGLDEALDWYVADFQRINKAKKKSKSAKSSDKSATRPKVKQ